MSVWLSASKGNRRCTVCGMERRLGYRKRGFSAKWEVIWTRKLPARAGETSHRLQRVTERYCGRHLPMRWRHTARLLKDQLSLDNALEAWYDDRA